jgi:hypothetical protein
MNRTQTLQKTRSLILIGTLSAVIATVGCSDDAKPVVKTIATSSKQTDFRPVNSATVKPISMSVPDEKSTLPAKTNPSKVTFNSRDYGISLQYPWQYTALRSKTIADNESLQPRPDGSDNQFSLVRIEVPKGFYPDTDLDSAYLIVSLNQDFDEGQCKAVLGDDKAQSESINGTEFFWKESDTGGRGNASKLRNYITYQNGTCYELEMGIKTKNDRGLSKEVNTNQVMARLDAILKSVKVKSDESNPEPKKVADAKELVSQK